MAQNRILIISPKPHLRIDIRTSLDGNEYTIFEASRWDEALAYIERVPPTLIFFDLDISPEDTLLFLEQTPMGPTAPYEIVGISSSPDSSSYSVPMDMGMQHVLALPIDSKRIEILTRQILHLREMLQQLLLEKQLQSEKVEIVHTKLDEKSEELKSTLTALQTKNKMLSFISHDFRAPVSVISGFTELLMETDLEPDHRVWVESIQESGLVLQGLADEVLALQQSEDSTLDLQPVAFNLKDKLERLVNRYSVLAQKKELNLSFSYGGNAPYYVFGDENRLSRIAQNLLSNAIKFTHQGSIHLAVQGLPKDGMAHLRLSVVDSGPGISEKDLARVFAPFEQLNSNNGPRVSAGGLGLTICKNLVEQMGGRIGVDSHLGEGSRFWVKLGLPLAPEPLPKDLNSPSKGSSSVKIKPTILVAEDDTLTKKLLRDILLNLGYQVELASNGQEAVLKSSQRIFDAILLDYDMPLMNGLQATQIIRANEVRTQLSPTPIIALTGTAAPKEYNDLEQAGITDHLIKPFENETLEALLRKHLSN